MDNTLETILRYIDSTFGLDSISALSWLISVMLFFLVLTCISALLQRKTTSSLHIRSWRISHIIIILLLGSSCCFSLSTFVTSYVSGHFYNFYVVIGLIAQMICSSIMAMSLREPLQDRRLEVAKRFMLHLNAVTIIFLVSARWLIRGVDAEETSSDTLNIYYNGRFEYSLHSGWYDLAPVDSIIKVILLRVCGNNNPFSPLETFMISFLSGLFLYILTYIYVRNRPFLYSLLPIIPALLALHPYALLPGLYVTPTNIAVALALASLVVFLHPVQNSSRSHLIVSRLLFITSLLAHPFSLSALLFVAACLFAKCIDRSLRSHDTLFFASISTLWIAKTIFTATIYGVVNIGESVVNGIFQAWERESVIEFRNVGYLGLPKLALASFSAPLGIIGGLSMITFIHTLLKRHVNNRRWLSLSIILFAAFTGLASLLAALGGQSRYVFLPFASLFFLPILFYGEVKGTSHSLKALITIAAILTILTPNFMPDQYSFYMAAKVTDETMFATSRFFFEKLDPNFVISRFQGTSSMRLYIDQESGFIRNMGETGLIVDKLILPGIVKAKSYWDFLGRGPFDVIEEGRDYSMANIIANTGLIRVLSLWTSP